MATLTFSQISLVTIAPKTSSAITVPALKAWKIESAGIGGTKGTIYLRDSVPDNIAILFSTIDQDDYGSPLPFWLPAGFTGSFYNDSTQKACISITVYDVV